MWSLPSWPARASAGLDGDVVENGSGHGVGHRLNLVGVQATPSRSSGPTERHPLAQRSHLLGELGDVVVQWGLAAAGGHQLVAKLFELRAQLVARLAVDGQLVAHRLLAAGTRLDHGLELGAEITNVPALGGELRLHVTECLAHVLVEQLVQAAN